MQTFDVSVNVLNDKLLFTKTVFSSAPQSANETKVKKEFPAEPSILKKCIVKKIHIVLYVALIQLVVFVLIFAQGMLLKNAWTSIGSIILLFVPVCTVMLVSREQSVTHMCMCWSLLSIHNVAICMLLHVESQVVVIGALFIPITTVILRKFTDKTPDNN